MKNLKRILKDFGTGLIPGSLVLQGIENDKLGEKLTILDTELAKLGVKGYKSEERDYNALGKLKNKVQRNFCVVCDSIVETGLGVYLSYNAAKNFATGYPGAGIADIGCYLFAKEIWNYMNRDINKTANKRIEEKTERRDKAVQDYIAKDKVTKKTSYDATLHAFATEQKQTLF